MAASLAGQPDLVTYFSSVVSPFSDSSPEYTRRATKYPELPREYDSLHLHITAHWEGAVLQKEMIACAIYSVSSPKSLIR